MDVETMTTQNAAEPAEVAEPTENTDAYTNDDAILPEDYEEGKPYAFEYPDGDPTEDPAELPEDPGEPAGEDTPDEKAQPAADQPVGGEGTPANVPVEDPAVPAAQDTAPVPSMYKFTDTFQGMSREVELDLKEIPTMYRKAQTADFVVRRTTERDGRARALGYEGVDDMLAKVRAEKIEKEVAALVDDNVHEVIARDVVSRRYPEFVRPAMPLQRPAAPAQPAQGVRDFNAELSDLLAAHPSLRGQKLPQEVSDAAQNGKHLLNAYNEFLLKHNNEELSRVTRENEILRQNAAAAAQAPVRGVSGGGAADSKPEDYFLKGLLSDN